MCVCVCVLSAVLVAFGFCGFRFFGGAGNRFNDSFVQLKLFAVLQFNGSYGVRRVFGPGSRQGAVWEDGAGRWKGQLTAFTLTQMLL